MSEATVVSDDAPAAERPRAVQWAWWATLGWAALTVAASVGLYGFRSFVYDALVEANGKAKAPKANYTGRVVNDDVSSALATGVVASIVSAAILLLVGYFMIRGRGWARWLLLGLATVLPIILRLGVGIVFQLVAGVLLNAPLVYKTVVIAAGLCSLAVAVLLLLPETNRHFAALRSDRPVRQGALFARPAAGGTVRPPGRLGALLGDNRGPAASPVTDRPDRGTVDDAVQPPSGPRRPAVKRPTATRPGSVKPKGAGPSAGRSKSRRT